MLYGDKVKSAITTVERQDIIRESLTWVPSEEAAGRCDEGVFLRIGYSKIAAGAAISTTILPFNLLKYGTVKLLEMSLSLRLNWKKIGYSDFAALYPIFPYHGERRQRIILLI